MEIETKIRLGKPGLHIMGRNKQLHVTQIRAVAGQRSSPALCFATKSIKSMTKDIDLNVTQVGRDTSDQYLPTC